MGAKKLSAAHRLAIKRAMEGKKLSEHTKLLIKKRLADKHHNRYEWILINPRGEMIRTKTMRSFCQENNLSYSSMRYKSQMGDSRPISRGPSQGWVVFSAKRIKTQ